MAEWIEVRVKPNAKISRFEKGGDGIWTARVSAPPVDGKANRELIAMVAKEFGVPRGAVEIRTGAGARTKRIRVDR